MLARSIDKLEESASARREERVLQLLGRLVPEYRRSPRRQSTGRDWWLQTSEHGGD